MKRESPTEREIADLIASAYEGWVVPDPRRLATIEQQLLAQTGSRGRSKVAWWWLVGTLVASAATAMWWVVNYDSADGQKQPVPGIVSPTATKPTVEQPAPPSRSEGTESSAAGEPARKQGPVIYQRER
jgi:hypothetical protein